MYASFKRFFLAALLLCLLVSLFGGCAKKAPVYPVAPRPQATTNAPAPTPEETSSAAPVPENEDPWLDSDAPMLTRYAVMDGLYLCEFYEEWVDIVRYYGTDTDLVVPAVIEDLPVRKVSGIGYMDNLQTITFSEGIREIYGVTANKNLVSISIPGSVRRLTNNAFSFCTALTSVTIPEGVTIIDNAFSGCTALETVSFPSSLLRIVNNSFKDCDGLTVLDLPQNLIELGSFVFVGCDGLTSLTLPKNLVSIDEYTFSECSTLTTVVFPETLQALYTGVLRDCPVLSSVSLPDTAIYVGQAVLDGTAWKETLLQANSSEPFIPFNNHTLLAYNGPGGDVVIPENFISIAGEAFDNSSPDSPLDILSVQLPANLLYIGDRAFTCLDTLASVEMPDSVCKLGKSVFSGCVNLQTVTLSAALTDIPAHTFETCGRMTEITIPAGVLSIGESAFEYCIALQSVSLPDSLQTIALNAFAECTSLPELRIPAGLLACEDCFQNCPALQVYCSASNPAYTWASAAGVYGGE